MSKLNIKNLIINNTNKIMSSLCLIGLAGTLLVVSEKQEQLPEEQPTYTTITLREIPEELKPQPVQNDPAPMHFNIDDMVSRADEDFERIQEEKLDEYINNLEVAYETGYDEVYDTTVDNETFELTYDNPTYEDMSEEDFYMFVANVTAEASTNPHDILATASSVANRCDSDKWVSYVSSFGLDGTNPADQVTAPGQYNVYASGTYKNYLDGNVSEEALYACMAVLYRGVRTHNFCSFRGRNCVGYSDNQVVAGGNRFGGEELQTAELPLSHTSNNIKVLKRAM